MKHKHLIRAAGVVVAIIFVAFVLPKLLPTSQVEGLQAYGFYAGHNNSTEWKQLPVQYAEAVKCNPCHNDKYAAWSKSVHQSINCENCHGSGSGHIEKGDALVVNPSKELCITCHSEVVGRPADFPQIDAAKHGKGLLCISCHNPHNPVIPAVPHAVDAATNCLTCHAADGIKPFPKDHAGRTGFCLTCHQPE